MTDFVRQTLSTAEMAAALEISTKLLLTLRKADPSPFESGVHYRFAGRTTAAPVRWFPLETDEAFTKFKRVDPNDIETMPGLA